MILYLIYANNLSDMTIVGVNSTLNKISVGNIAACKKKNLNNNYFNKL